MNPPRDIIFEFWMIHHLLSLVMNICVFLFFDQGSGSLDSYLKLCKLSSFFDDRMAYIFSFNTERFHPSNCIFAWLGIIFTPVSSCAICQLVGQLHQILFQVCPKNNNKPGLRWKHYTLSRLYGNISLDL